MAENNRKQLIGQVVESKMEKTAVVQIDRRGPHPVYKNMSLSQKNIMFMILKMSVNQEIR